jgi:hypothetical protein
MKTVFICGSLLLCLAISGQTKSIKANLIRKNSSILKGVSAPPSNMYSFSTFTAPFQNINGVLVSDSVKWDDMTDTIPLGFNFKIYNATVDTLFLFGGQVLTPNDVNSDPYITGISPMFEDFCDRAFLPNSDTEGDPGGISRMSYTTVGVPGSRICKIEVDSAGFFAENDANNVSTSHASFQVWLFETSNNIEFHFGAVNIDDPTLTYGNGPNGFVCGLFDSIDVNTAQSLRSNMLDGPYNNPTMVVLDPNFTDAVSGNIDIGRVYRFTRSISTDLAFQKETSRLAVYSDAASQRLIVEGDLEKEGEYILELFNLTGQKIYSGPVKKETDLSTAETGIYLVKIRSSEGKSLHTGKIVVTR